MSKPTKLTKALAIMLPDGSTRVVTLRQSQAINRKIKRELFKDAKADVMRKLKNIKLNDCKFLVEDENGEPKEV